MNAITRHWQAVRSALEDERTRAERQRIEESAFLPAALEIVEKPVSPTGRITAWVLLAGVAAVVAWAVLGKVDVVASARGKVIPAANVQLIQPTDQGVVRAILVQDGQTVRAGQPLISLDPTVSTAEAVQAQAALNTAQLDAARDRAVISALDGHGLAFVAPPGTPAEVVRSQIALAQAQVAQINATTSARGADSSAARAALAEAQVQAKKLNETLPLLDQQIAANQYMADKGYVSKLRLIEMQRQRLGAARDRDAALQTARRQRAEIEAATSTREQARAEGRTNVLTDLNKAEADARLRVEELAKARLRSSLQILRAPVNGTVAQLAVHTVGGVVEAAKPIALVVPSGGPLLATVNVLNKDAGGVRQGQPVAVKLDAYPFTRYGTIRGHVLTVSSDAVNDEHLGLVYEAKVQLDESQAALAARGIRMIPGMSATADIRTGRRSILSYLMSPIEATAREAGREQ